MTLWNRLHSLEHKMGTDRRQPSVLCITDLTDEELACIIAHGTDLLPEQVLALSDADLASLIGTLQARENGE
jgi:hypothetical protein